MSDFPTVSVLTTVYNRAKFLGECIESVQLSRFTDYEHIIVDDGSTDDSVAIARRYAAEDTRIKVFVNDQNLGDYPNRNQAAKHASGKYLKYLDADDLHGPWILNVMVDAMEQFPDAGLGLFAHGKGSTHVAHCLSPDEAFNAHYKKGIRIFSRSPLGAIIRTSAFHELGGFPEHQHVGDHEFWHTIGSVHPTVVMPSKLAHYRIHDDQQSADNRTDLSVPFKYYDAAIRGTTKAKANVLDPALQELVLQTIRKRQARTVLVHLKRMKLQSAAQLKKQSGLTWGRLIHNAK